MRVDRGCCGGGRVFGPEVNACGQPVDKNSCYSYQHSEPDTDCPRVQRLRAGLLGGASCGATAG